MYTLRKNAIILLALACAVSGRAATITVTGAGDTPAVDGMVTLREAITSLNNGANVNADVVAVGAYGSNDTIAFAIPGAGVHTIAAANGLPLIAVPMLIDGYTQPGAVPNSNGPEQGSNAQLMIEISCSNGGCIAIAGGNSTLRGLVVNGRTGSIYIQGKGGNTISGNFLGTNPAGTAAVAHAGASLVDILIGPNASGNTIGGTTPAARNVISGTADVSKGGNSGILIDSANNVVQGNLIGTNAAGDAALGNDLGIEILIGGADNNRIGGPSAAERNVISGNRLDGIDIYTVGNRIEGNYVGTDVSGTFALPNGNFGIAAAGTGNTIGGTAAGAGNLVSGNANVGIVIPFGTSGNAVQGNRVGTDASGSGFVCGHSMAGIEVSGGGNLVGGSQAGAANLIAFNKNDGVRVDGGNGSSIIHNSIFSNGGAGVRLGSGVVPNVNDAGDADSGPNNLQNYPLLSVSAVGAGGFNIDATLNSTIGTFHLEFFSSRRCGRLGHGEGQSYIGSADVLTDNNGNATFGPQFFFASAGQTALTATATDAAGNTSEFSACLDDRIFADGFEPQPGVCQ